MTMLPSNPLTDPFQVDIRRHGLAIQQDYRSLLESYTDVAHYPPLPDLSSKKLWDGMSSYEVVPDFRIRRLQEVANRIPSECEVLDVGSGWGEIVPMILSRPGRRYTGLDFSNEMIGKVSQKYPQGRFICGDISEVQNHYDVVMALEVCEHIGSSSVMKFYAQVKRVLKPGGMFIISVPLYEDLRAMTLQCPECGHLHNRMGHVRRYSPELVRTELWLAGFRVKSISFTYASFSNDFQGIAKRKLVDMGRKVLGMGMTPPLGAIVVATLDVEATPRVISPR